MNGCCTLSNAFFKTFYLFIWRTEITSRQRGRQRERGGSRLPSEHSTEPDAGLDPRTPESWPEPKAEDLTHWATQVPLKCFFYIFWNDQMILLLLLIWCITMIDLLILKHPHNLGINPIWSWWWFFLMYCWIQFASILLRIFASMLTKDTGLEFFLWCLCLILVSA